VVRPVAAALLGGLLFLSASAVATAEASLTVLGSYSVPHHDGYRASGFAFPDYSVVEGGEGERDLGSSWGSPAAKLSLAFRRSAPFLAGTGPLVAGNSLAGSLSFDLSPVSGTAAVRLSLTPIAFLSFDAGASLGTGWTLGSFHGLSLNTPEALDPLDLGGAVWSLWGAGTFQFDLAALVPGQWSHVVFLATGKIVRMENTAAEDDEAWDWENERDDYFNAARFCGTYVLGYQMPARVDFIGVMAESEEWLGSIRDISTMASPGGWGSDFRLWHANLLANIALGRRDSLAVIGQFRRSQDWTDGTTAVRYFGSRDYDNPVWHFRRLVLSYTHHFK
jgi:hypothetical protein